MWTGISSSSNVVNAAAALTIAALVIAGLTLARDFLIPLALAGLFSFLLQPAVRWLDDHSFPRPAAVALVVFSLLATMGAASALLAREVSAFAEELPRYQTNLSSKIRDAADRLASVGVWRTATEALRRMEGEIQEQPKGGGPVKVEVQNGSASPFLSAAKYLQLLIPPLTSAGLALLFTVFILLQYHDLRDRIVRLMGPAEIGRSTQALNDAAVGLAHFFRLQAALNLSFGFVIGICLWAIGLPNAPLWGALAAILRFVPYIGGALSALLPMALAAAVEPGWTSLLLTAALFGIAEFLTAHIIEPLLFGTNTRISPLAVLLAAAFWTTIWGPIGLILAMPITLALVVFADHVPMLSPIGVLLGNAPALSPEQRLYHLLLAGDASASVEDVESWLDEERPLTEYLDKVAIPAFSIAASDAARDVLHADQLGKLKETVDDFVELVEDLVEQRLEKQEENTSTGDRPLIKALILPARGAFDQAAGKLLALAARLETRSELTLAAGSGLTGINAALQDRNVKDLTYAAILSVGEATPPQLRLVIRRLSRALSMPVGVLIGDRGGSAQIEHEPFAQADVFASSKALLDRIRATADRSAPSSAATSPRPIVSAVR
jgi:predicted PurR-regulated permease PerM